jgi:hypothetical protein
MAIWLETYLKQSLMLSFPLFGLPDYMYFLIFKHIIHCNIRNGKISICVMNLGYQYIISVKTFLEWADTEIAILLLPEPISAIALSFLNLIIATLVF